MAAPAGFAADGGDPRLSIAGSAHFPDYARPQTRKLHDHTITFEEYHYYAEITRASEEERYQRQAPTEKSGILSVIFPSKSYKPSGQRSPTPIDEKSVDGSPSPQATGLVTDEEWVNASRAMRTASWSAVFYLITTDILGPFNAPFAVASLGWGPGVALYTVFGFLAGYSGYLLWKIFLGMDSDQYPLKSYGDVFFRLYGRLPRHLCNFLQSVQLLSNVGVIIIGNGLGLSQVSKFRLCFVVCCVIWAACGFVVGQVRTLQKYGWLANAAVWMNVLVIFISMGVVAHSEPNYTAAQAASAGSAIWGIASPEIALNTTTNTYPPIMHSANLPNTANFIGALNGLMQGVYAYGGAMLFNEFMSEMRRPRDFFKAMAISEMFIWICYMTYGLVVYHYQGQYANQTAFQGISIYGWQTVCNMFSVLSGLIAAGLYGNIGIKVLYQNILMEFFYAPPLTEKRGKWLWAIIVPIYWTTAFCFAASVPDFFGLTSIIAALCILQFTYTFPPMLALGYWIKAGAMQPGEDFDPTTGQVIRHDNGLKRWTRGFMKEWYINVWNIIYMLGAGATAGLGAYAACESLISAFQSPQVNSFSCTSPLAPT